MPRLFRALAMKVPVRAALRPPSAPRHPGSAGSAAAAFRSGHPGRPERRHLAARAPAPIPGSRARCAKRWAWSSRSAASACRRMTSPCWRPGRDVLLTRAAESGRRADRRLALAAAADATDARAWAWKMRWQPRPIMLAIARRLADVPARPQRMRRPRRRRRSRRGRASSPSPKSKPGCAIPMRSMPSMC